MKRVTLSMIAMFLAIQLNVNAQLPNDTLAPDFVATDINGVEHHLQEYLSSGKTIIIDFFTVWCGPCWYYHEEGILEEAWSLYGPDGTDELMIFQIEIEPTMGMEEMLGNGEYTMGNWLEDVEYPTIDDLVDSTNTSPALFGTIIGDAYNVQGVPSIVVICPSGFITNDFYPYMSAEELNEFALNCTLATEQVDAAIHQYVGDIQYCDYVLDEPQVQIQNLSLGGNLTTANIQTIINGEVISNYVYNGNLALYESDTVTLDPVFNLSQNSTITFRIEMEGDTNFENNEKTVDVHRVEYMPNRNLIVEVKPDDYPQDFVFIMEDGDGNIIYESESISNNLIHTFEIVIPENVCVIWTVYDAFGDGMYDGYVRLLDAETNEELIYIDGNNYFYIHKEMFTNINYTGIAQNEEVKVGIYPNPTNDFININVSAEITSLEIVNVLGQQVMDIPVSQSKQYQISVKSLPSGIYFLNLKGHNLIQKERFLKK